MTVATAPEMEIFEIPSANMPRLREKLEKLNRRAARRGTAPIVLTEHGIREETNKDGEGFKTRRILHMVSITGEAPRVDGWVFIATLQHLGEEAGNVVRAVPGESIPTEFRTADPTNCDHCHVNRRRIDTFVIRKEDGSGYAQVGRNCLGDFLGGIDPKDVVSRAEFLIEARMLGESYGSGGWDRYLDTEQFLAFTAAAVRQFGWVSRGKARASAYDENPLRATADIVLTAVENAAREKVCIFTGKDRCWENPCPQHFTPEDADNERAKNALEWSRTKLVEKSENAPDNDYLYNLRVICALDSNEVRSAGLLASLIAVYNREMDFLREQERKSDALPSEWIGNVGDKITVTVEVVSVKELPGYMGGVTLLYKMLANGKDTVTWFQSSGAELEPGKTYTLKASIKKCDEYKSVKQTVITRAKIVS